MQNSIEHLPASRRKHLDYIVGLIRDEFEQVTGFANGKKKHSRILKIILFGSHATGKWVNDPAHGYVSDYDILVILNRRDLVEEYSIWDKVEDRFNSGIRPPLTLLVHTLEEVNDALTQGQYFFTDIKREGIVLYESDRRELAQEGNLSPADYKTIAEKYYAQWFESAVSFYDSYEHKLSKRDLKIAAFLLHQTTERFYTCLLLVLTNYKPNTHNLKQLNLLCISQNPCIAEVFPQDKRLYRRRFQLLKCAYVEARYSEHYEISVEELHWLAERVQLLQTLTETLCQEKIASLG